MDLTTTATQEQDSSVRPERIRYIRALNEPREIYERYFDALLIKRGRHGAFYRDLKAFRSQVHIIQLLNSDDAKTACRECTTVFLESRYAHPWCRTSPSSQEGWSKAQFGGIIRKASTDGNNNAMKEEARLHRLLLPIWCGFRKRMNPSDEQMALFLEKEAEQPSTDGVTSKKIEESSDEEDHIKGAESDDEGLPTSSNADTGTGDAPANAAAKFFVGMAAAGMLLENKRVRKYLLKKL